MAERKELQEKIIAYRVLEARLDSLAKQRDMLASKLIEIQTTLQSIDEIEKSENEILFPIGSEAYTFGKATNKKKVIVEIGANIALEKTVEDGRESLEKRKLEIEDTLNAAQKNIVEISSNLDQLGQEIEGMAKEIERMPGAG